jgi:opacity protein-like surface antigen
MLGSLLRKFVVSFFTGLFVVASPIFNVAVSAAEASIQTARANSPAATASKVETRFFLGAGATGGDPDIEYSGVSDSLDVGTGIAATAGLWWDRVGGLPWLSVGAQYLRLQDFDYSESASGTLLGANLTVGVDIEPTIDAFFANAAARLNEGSVHPYAGAGIGFARADADITASATITVSGQTFHASGTASDDDLGLAYQAYAGIDFDITESISLGANLSYVRVDADLFGADVEFKNITGLLVLGIKF